jgi:hypothetical protein
MDRMDTNFYDRKRKNTDDDESEPQKFFFYPVSLNKTSKNYSFFALILGDYKRIRQHPDVPVEDELEAALYRLGELSEQNRVLIQT